MATAGIRPPLPVETPPPFLMTTGLLVALAVLILLARIWRRVRARGGAAPGPAQVAPDRRAHLAALVADAQRGERNGTALLVELDGLLRAEWAARTGQPVSALTSRELGRLVADAQDPAHRAGLVVLLDALDQVKFNGQPAAAERVLHILALAEQLWEAVGRRSET